MGDQLKTEPGWKPARRGPSDRLLIAIIGALVALAEGWRAVVPTAQAATDAEVSRRVEKLETKVDKLVEDVAGLKAQRK